MSNRDNKKDQSALPAQPLNRLRLLEVIRDQLKTADGKSGISFVANSQERYDAMGDVLPDGELQTILFNHVKDGDERAIIRRFFANIDE
jgi:hypothetical protein